MLEIKLTEYDAGAVEAGTGDVFVVEIEGYDEPVKIERWMTHHGSGVDLYSIQTGRNIEGSVARHLEERLGEEQGTAVFEYLTGDFLSEVSDRYERSLNAEGYYEMAKRAKAHAEATPFVLPEDELRGGPTPSEALLSIENLRPPGSVEHIVGPYIFDQNNENN